MTLALIAAHGSVGGNGYAVEYAGPAVEALEIEARLTLCNMATEFSAVTGFIAPDAKTFSICVAERTHLLVPNGSRRSSHGKHCAAMTAPCSTKKS